MYISHIYLTLEFTNNSPIKYQNKKQKAIGLIVVFRIAADNFNCFLFVLVHLYQDCQHQLKTCKLNPPLQTSLPPFVGTIPDALCAVQTDPVLRFVNGDKSSLDKSSSNQEMDCAQICLLL